MAFRNRFSYLQHMLNRCTLGRMCMLPLHDDMPYTSQLHTGICFYKMHQRIPRNILKELFSHKLPKFYPSQKKRKTPTNKSQKNHTHRFDIDHRNSRHKTANYKNWYKKKEKNLHRRNCIPRSKATQTKISGSTDMVQRNYIHGSITLT